MWWKIDNENERTASKSVAISHFKDNQLQLHVIQKNFLNQLQKTVTIAVEKLLKQPLATTEEFEIIGAKLLRSTEVLTITVKSFIEPFLPM